jgi:hypothetical protein
MTKREQSKPSVTDAVQATVVPVQKQRPAASVVFSSSSAAPASPARA